MTSNETERSTPLVYVVTLTWNQREDTLECLESLSQMYYSNYRLLLVDNASIDDTVKVVKERFPDVEIVANSHNLGFSGGFNVGLRYALDHGADYIFMINNDTFVEPGILDELVVHVEKPGVGMASPKIYYADEPNRIWTVGGNKHPWTLEMTDKGEKQLDHGQWEDVIERDYLIGCALLIKRTMLEQVGFLDTGYYPIYYEDADLSLRAREAGYRLLMVPSAKMWHKVSASGGGNDAPRVRYLMARNSLRFFRKHARGWNWLTILPYRMGSAILWTFRLLLRGRFRSILAHWRGLWDGLIQREVEAPSRSAS